MKRPKGPQGSPARSGGGRGRSSRTFVYRAGVRIEGTHVTCDAHGSASDLVFLSHAQAVMGAKPGGLRRAGRQELLVTEATLALLGRAGERLRRQALPAPFGRPFVLGEVRLELLSSGHLPGAASLFCEAGERRVLYAGTIRREAPAFGATPAEVRSADAVCVDATFGRASFVFPAREEALARTLRFVEAAFAAGRAPVLLAPPFGAAMDVAAHLAGAGVALRAHRSMVAAASAFRAAGAAAPVLARFQGKLAAREALLWPPEARAAALLGALTSPTFAFVSGFSLDAEVLARVRADEAIPLSTQSGYPDLIAYLETTGAREVALVRGFAEDLAEDLRRRGYDAYALGPPRQMELFRG